MRKPTVRRLIARELGPWLAALAGWASPWGLAHAETAGAPPDPPPAVALEERLRRVEEVNARLLERLDSDREASDRRYRELEQRYLELKRHVDEPRPDPTSEPDGPRGPGGEQAGRASHLGRPGELGRAPGFDAIPLKGQFADGFLLVSRDDEFDLRFHVLDQTDFKLFARNDRTFGKSGLYIPRVRLYLEGRLTRFWDYEVSLQRSLEGTWDLLDGNVNFHPSDAFQLKFGRQLVPYSYAWFDHLEQYFVVPERSLFQQVERRTTVVPLRPFRPIHGEWGPGAIEPFVRYSQLNLGRSSFKDDLADGHLWTKDVSMVDLGVNWYPNRWIKFYLEWQHAAFGSAVLVNEAKGIFGRSSDLLWIRGQVYF